MNTVKPFLFLMLLSITTFSFGAYKAAAQKFYIQNNTGYDVIVDIQDCGKKFFLRPNSRGGNPNRCSSFVGGNKLVTIKFIKGTTAETRYFRLPDLKKSNNVVSNLVAKKQYHLNDNKDRQFYVVFKYRKSIGIHITHRNWCMFIDHNREMSLQPNKPC